MVGKKVIIKSLDTYSNKDMDHLLGKIGTIVHIATPHSEEAIISVQFDGDFMKYYFSLSSLKFLDTSKLGKILYK